MRYKSLATPFNSIVLLFAMAAALLLSSRGKYADLVIVNRVGHAIIFNQLGAAYGQAALMQKNPQSMHELNCRALVGFKRSFELNPQDPDVYHNLTLILEVTRGSKACSDVH